MVLGVYSNAFAINERQNFRNEYNEIKAYSDKTMADVKKSDIVVIRFEAQEVFARIDNLLNRVYKYLKNTKAKKDFDSIIVEQRKWVNDKEADAKLASKVKNEDKQEQIYEQYRVYNEYTFKRCSELIDMVDDDINTPEIKKTSTEKAHDKFSNEMTFIERYAQSIYNDETLNQFEINYTSDAIQTKWENLMNEMVSHLKISLDAKSAESLEQDQKEYVELAEKKAKEEEANWEGGSGCSMAVSGSYTNSWSNRCKALIDMIETNTFESQTWNSIKYYEDIPEEDNRYKTEYQTKFEIIEAEESDRDKRFGNSKNDAAYLKETQNIFTKWDKLLNQVYTNLKENLGEEKFEVVKKAQRAWIKEKEKASATARSNSRGGNADLSAVVSDTELTKERIKILIDLVEN